MKIVVAYETSKGLFWSKESAEKLENRARNLEWSYYIDRYEDVSEVYVLVADVERDCGVRGTGTSTVAFKLNPVEIK